MRYPWQPLLLAAVLVAGSGCLRNISQSSRSGKDFKPKGAKTIELEEGEGRAKDIVTYPGGDRSDWKMFELPEGQKGKLRVKVRYKPARPGMDIAFEVYDEWFDRVGRSKPSKHRDKRRASGSKSVRVKNARGKYYVQIYAPERMDAARYTVSVQFKETKEPPPVALIGGDEIDDPPNLPQVPKPPPPPEETPVTPQPVTTMTTQPAEPPPPLTPAVAPVKARIVSIQSARDGVIVVLSKGEKDGVQRGANAQVLLGDSDSPLDSGDFKIINVNKSQSVGKIKSLGIDQVKKNKIVLISPP